MARAFTAASATALTTTSSPTSVYPCTMAIWCRPTGAGGTSQALFSLKYSVAADDRDHATLTRDVGAAGKFLHYISDYYGVAAYTQCAASYVVGQWHHVCAVMTSTTSRAIFMDGGNKATNTVTVAAPGWDRVSVGHVPETTHYYGNADLAEAALWSIALTDADVALLGLGLSPLFVRPDALVFYAPLLGATSPEIELVGRRELALVNAPPVVPHPRVIVPLGSPQVIRKRKIYVLAGVTKNSSGVIVAGCTVKLFRTSDNAYIGQVTSDGSGAYTFSGVAGGTNYYLIAYKPGSPDVMGTTVNTLQGV